MANLRAHRPGAGSAAIGDVGDARGSSNAEGAQAQRVLPERAGVDPPFAGILAEKERWRDYVRRRSRKLLAFGFEVEDVLQEAFREAWDVRHRLVGMGQAACEAWFAGLVDNTLRELTRGEARRRRRDAAYRLGVLRGHCRGRDGGSTDLVARDPGPAALAVSEEQGRLLHAAISALPPHQSSIIELFHFQEVPLRELGETMGRSVNAVKLLLTRARAALKQKLIAQKLADDCGFWGGGTIPGEARQSRWATYWTRGEQFRGRLTTGIPRSRGAGVALE